MFTGNYMATLIDVVGTPDQEGRVQYVLSTAATIRCRVAPLSEEERSHVRPIHDVSTVVVIGGTIPCNPKQWINVHYPHGTITYRIHEVRWLGNEQQRLMCDVVSTANVNREETFFDLAMDDGVAASWQVEESRRAHPASH